MFKKIDKWLRNIVWEETQEASKHFGVKTDPYQTAKIVKLMLDLHDKKWSYETDAFLRELNINPEKYWKKYGVFPPKPVKQKEKK